MADLKNHKTFKNTKFEVLTDEGFKDFKGIIIGKNVNKLKFKFSNGKELTCTPMHKIITNNKFNWIYAKDLKLNDTVYANIKLISIEKFTNEAPVYELLEVSDNHRYFANGILSHQCLILDELAFIDNHLVEEFWRSVYPIISSSKKSKIFIASTPNGTDNLFYELYNGATEGKNDWKAERVDWWEVPGRDDEWKEKTVRSLGSMEAFEQEFGNVFLQSGESSVNDKLFEEMKTEVKEPEFVYDDGKYLLWDTFKQDRIYVAGVDISEGVGAAASVIQILDITNLRNIEQVATYHDRNISPYNFTAKLHEILQHWGSPLALIERNNCGAQVVDQLKNTLHYENIVTYGIKNPHQLTLANNKIGVQAHTNTKYKGVTNMRYWVNELKAVKIRDLNTLIELKNFIRYSNGTWGARPGIDNWDDRVMSLVWSLVILENELAEKYFEIVEFDENRKPLKIKSLDYGIKYFVNPNSIYNNEKNKTEYVPSPVIMQGNKEEGNQDISELEQMGWRLLNG